MTEVPNDNHHDATNDQGSERQPGNGPLRDDPTLGDFSVDPVRGTEADSGIGGGDALSGAAFSDPHEETADDTGREDSPETTERGTAAGRAVVGHETAMSNEGNRTEGGNPIDNQGKEETDTAADNGEASASPTQHDQAAETAGAVVVGRETGGEDEVDDEGDTVARIETEFHRGETNPLARIDREMVRNRFETMRAMKQGQQGLELESRLIAVGRIEPATISRSLESKLFRRRLIETNNGLLEDGDPLLEDSEIKSAQEAFNFVVDEALDRYDITSWTSESRRIGASYDGYLHFPWHIDVPTPPRAMLRFTARLGEGVIRAAEGTLTTDDVLSKNSFVVHSGGQLRPADELPLGTVVGILPGVVHASPNSYSSGVLLQRSIFL